MDSKTWKIALDVFDTYGDLSVEEFTNEIEKLSVTQEVRNLLIELKSSENEASSFFDGLQENVKKFVEPPIPDNLGAWTIKTLIDTGGMSSVYLAERDDDQFSMKGAVKFIHFSGYNPKVFMRFKREMQFLAMLDHPNITRIIDSGVTDYGTPWYVMEYVDGKPITTYCNENKLNLEERLHLFIQVCDAVQHAHKNLVIHRDLKPNNIFVDQSGHVKLLDFGIAKAFSNDDSENDQQLLTRENTALMTPEYASPEQLEGSAVSTSSDVYSLSVVLHELITGQRPYRFDEINRVKMVNKIRNNPLPKPSTVFKSQSDKPKGIKAQSLSRELDDILMAALRVEPDRRYASAEQLERDLKNYLNNDPVMARADSRRYRFQKFVQRNKTAVALGALSLFILFTSMAALLWQSRVISLERDVAQTEAAMSDAVREHMLFLFREAGSLAGDTGQVSARELLDKSADVADQWLQDDPEVQRQVYAVLGEIMLALNDYSSAESLLERVIESETESDSPILRSMIYRDMAQVHHSRGNFEEGFKLVDEAANMLEGLPGDHRARLSDILQIRGRLHRDLGRRELAISDLERARDLADEVSSVPRPLLARAEGNLGTTLLMNGDVHRARTHFEQAEEFWHSLGRPESTEALSVMNNLAVLYNRLGMPEEAIDRFRRVTELRMEHYGESGALAASLMHLGRLLITTGELEKAENFINQSKEMALRFVGESTPSHAVAYLGLGELNRTRGNYDEAYEHFEQAITMFESIFGPIHPHTLLAKSELVNTQREMNGSIDHSYYNGLVKQAAEMGPAANIVLSGIHCQAVRNAIMLDDLETARDHAVSCKEIRDNMELTGWRELEANAILELVNALEGNQESIQKLQNEIEQLGELITDQHPSMAWLNFVSQSLFDS